LKEDWELALIEDLLDDLGGLILGERRRINLHANDTLDQILDGLIVEIDVTADVPQTGIFISFEKTDFCLKLVLFPLFFESKEEEFWVAKRVRKECKLIKKKGSREDYVAT